MVVSLTCLSVFCGTIAHAEERAGLTLTMGTSLYVLERPQYAPFGAFTTGPTNTGYTRIAVNDDTAMGALGTMTLGAHTGTPLFFELSGRYFSDTERDTGAYTKSTYGSGHVGWFSPSGKYPVMGTTGTLYSNVKSRFSETGLGLLGGYEMELGRRMTLTPLFGYEVLRLSQKYDMDAGPSVGTFYAHGHDYVESWYHGPRIGLRLQGVLDEYTVSLSGSVAGYLVLSQYDGTLDTNHYSDHVDLSDTTAATGLELTADLSRSWGPWSAGLNATLRRLSYLPEIVSSATSAASNFSRDDARPVHLGAFSSLGYALGFNLRYDF